MRNDHSELLRAGYTYDEHADTYVRTGPMPPSLVRAVSILIEALDSPGAAAPANIAYQLLSVSDTAKLLSQSVVQTRRLIHSGELMAHRSGRRVLIGAPDLRAYQFSLKVQWAKALLLRWRVDLSDLHRIEQIQTNGIHRTTHEGRQDAL